MKQERRVIIVGDIHGCLDTFEALLRKVEYTSSDLLVSCGDLVDRGPNGPEVVNLTRELGAICVKGNHEDKLVRYFRHEQKVACNPGTKNPMKKYGARDYAQFLRYTEDQVEWMERLPNWVEVIPGWLVVHAGFDTRPLENQDPKVIQRVRYLDKDTGRMPKSGTPFTQPANSVHWAQLWQGPQNVVYGHIVNRLDSPTIHEGKGFTTYSIDTGACFGGNLTALVLNEGIVSFCQVQGAVAYAEWYNKSS
jgi:hypothetical protein